jgi:hypothetical protein
VRFSVWRVPRIAVTAAWRDGGTCIIVPAIALGSVILVTGVMYSRIVWKYWGVHEVDSYSRWPGEDRLAGWSWLVLLLLLCGAAGFVMRRVGAALAGRRVSLLDSAAAGARGLFLWAVYGVPFAVWLFMFFVVLALVLPGGCPADGGFVELALVLAVLCTPALHLRYPMVIALAAGSVERVDLVTAYRMARTVCRGHGWRLLALFYGWVGFILCSALALSSLIRSLRGQPAYFVAVFVGERCIPVVAGLVGFLIAGAAYVELRRIATEEGRLQGPHPSVD